MIFAPALGFLATHGSRIAVYGVLVAAGLGVSWMHGFFSGRAALHEYRAAQATEAARVVVRQAAATVKVVNRYIKVAGATRVVTETVEKEVLRYVDSNPTQCLDDKWRRLHDAAALNAVPQPPARADGEGEAPPSAAEALTTTTENYAACHAAADRLDGLQDWVREQQRAGR